MQAERYLIADNRHVERGGWFQNALKDTLQSFLYSERLRGTGYDEDGLDAMEEDGVPHSDGESTGGTTENKPVECPECAKSFLP